MNVQIHSWLQFTVLHIMTWNLAIKIRQFLSSWSNHNVIWCHQYKSEKGICMFCLSVWMNSVFWHLKMLCLCVWDYFISYYVTQFDHKILQLLEACDNGLLGFKYGCVSYKTLQLHFCLNSLCCLDWLIY